MNNLINESVLEHYDVVKSLFEEKLPELIEWPESPQFVKTDIARELLLQTKKQSYVEEITTAIESLGYHVLIAIVSRNIRDYHVLCCAPPLDGNLLLVHINSCQHGLTDAVVFEFFDSSETMFSRINKLWNKYEGSLNGENPFILLEKMEKSEFWNLFV